MVVLTMMMMMMMLGLVCRFPLQLEQIFRLWMEICANSLDEYAGDLARTLLVLLIVNMDAKAQKSKQMMVTVRR